MPPRPSESSPSSATEGIAEIHAGNSPPQKRTDAGFWALIATQFQTAFSDNALKFLVIYIIVGLNLTRGHRDALILVVGALFAFPFILFSMLGGNLADRHSKRSVTIWTKFLEIAIMVFAIIALLIHSLPLECASVFLISSEAALFGPSKYGLLPELLPENRLSWGNGIIELGTFLASIGGTVASGFLATRYHGREYAAGLILLAATFAGLATSVGISRVPAADPERAFRWDPFGDLWSQSKIIGKDRVLTWAVLGNSYLFFLAALLQFTIVIFGHDVLHINDEMTSYLQTAVALGIGIGSLAAGYLSGGKIEYGLIPLGALGMTLFGAFLYRPGQTLATSAIHLGFLGFFGGFFVVPMGALIQHRPAPEHKGGVIAAANLYSFVGIFLAAGAYFLFSGVFHQTGAGIFLDGAALTLLATVVAIWMLPDSLLRFLLWIATHTIYRIRVTGRENVPLRGGALFVANHISLVDALLLMSSTDREIRFLIFEDIYNHPVIKPFAKLMHAIPVSSQQRPRELIAALHQASEAIRNGEIVCIFAEGQITRIGNLLPFRRGFERIMKGVEAPIVPVCLDGVWGSIFSFEKGRFLWKLPRRFPYPVSISFGKPLASTATAFEVRQAVQDLQADAFQYRRRWLRPLGKSLVRTAHLHPLRFAMADMRRPRVKWGAVLLSSIFLARRLKKLWARQEMVGIMLPPSVPGAYVNFAAVLCGKIPVNLNYTASNETLASCGEQCKLETVVTTQLLLDRLPVKPPGRTILIEDVAANPGLGEKIVALLLWAMPPAWLERVLSGKRPAKLDDLATIIFSSGSTGDPKGVMLTHFNIASNIAQMDQTFMLNRHDTLLGVLPFFHSFGFTVTLWLPATLGVGVAFHPTPIDVGAVGTLVREYRATFLITTPTFLQHYLRKIQPEDFGSLQFVLVGAEKLPDRVALAFEDRFGVRPLEGYGCTECSPVVAVNTKDYRAPGFRQVGSKRGRIGHPLPGITVRIVNPDTRAGLPLDTAGLLLVRGPNVMKGYLGKPEKTAEVLRDGWYTTGDIATLDEDGFLTITDRLSRFSKIGGEMVPHIKVEEKLHEIAGLTELSFVVTGVPDGKKGERLVVLHTLSDEELKAVLEKLSQADLPNLWIPRTNQFFHVDELPHLGSGKLDLRRLRETAMEFSGIE